MWFHGYGKIVVIPSINLEYSNDRGRDIKMLKGYTSRWVAPDSSADETISGQHEPPEGVMCMPSYDNQYFQPWNETLK